MLKKILLIAVIAAMAVTAVGCRANTTGSNTSSSESTTQATEQKTENTTTAEEAADKAGLKVDEKGNVTDKNGKKVSVKDGKVTVEVDGKKITVDRDVIKPITKTTNTSSQNSSSSASSGTTSKTTSSSNTSSNTSSSNTSSSDSSTSDNSSTSTSSKQESSSNTSSAPTESKIWHEAVYEYIEHPAVTEQVWVVDKAAYTYEEPVYETQWRTICNDCGADITGNAVSHAGLELKNGGKGSYRAEPREVQIGTKTVTVPEEGHYETRVVKEAWTEKKLVKEAGYY